MSQLSGLVTVFVMDTAMIRTPYNIGIASILRDEFYITRITLFIFLYTSLERYRQVAPRVGGPVINNIPLAI